MSAPPQGAPAADAATGWRGLRPASWGRFAGGLILGVGVFAAWWTLAGPLGRLRIVRPEALIGAGALLALALGLQVGRTAWLFPRLGWAGVWRPVVFGHGANTVFATAGDLAEAGWLVRDGGLPVGETLARLVVRAAGTAAAMAFSVAPVLGALGWALAGGVALAAVALARRFRRWLAWFGPEEHAGDPGLPWGPSLGMTAVACAQISLEAVALALVFVAVGEPLGGPQAMAARGLVELSTYLPVPLAGLGVHHVGLEAGLALGDHVGLGWGTVAHHAVSLALGGVAMAVGWPWRTSA